MQQLGRIAVRVKTLSPADSLGKAAEAVRNSTVGAVPVLDDGALLGLLTAGGLASFLTERSPDAVAGHTVADLPLERAVPMPEDLRAADALYYFEENGLSAAPVVDYGNGLVGMVSLAELAGAICGRGKLPVVGGMATPFGVYLTGGGVRGGVGDLALVTTGVFMATGLLLAMLVAQWVVSPPVWATPLVYLSRVTERWGPQVQASILEITMLLVFGLVFRLSWITGFHAAEHQTVHVLESGDDLDPDIVARMPRVHPRCGTNIVAAVGMMQVLVENLRHALGLGSAILVAMVATFLTWRRVGGALQQYVTTRPATPGQINSGIRAATQLIERYQSGPPPRLSFGRRLWNMGLLQVMLGYVIVYGPLLLLARLLGYDIPLDIL